MAVNNVAKYLSENPLIAIDVAAGTAGTALSYIGYATAAAGIAVPVAGQVIMGVVGTVCGIWGMYRLAASVFASTNEREVYMSKVAKYVSIILLGVAVLCVPTYLLTNVLVIGVVGYSSMMIGSIIMLCNAIGSVRKTDKKEMD